MCGDGVRDGAEDCDGADDGACPGACRATCECGYCGDDVVDQPGEACDGGDDGACPGACSDSCHCLSPTTDVCAEPRRLTLPGTDFQDVTSATTAPGDPLLTCIDAAGSQHMHSVWYVMTAPGTGRIRVDTDGSSFDTVLAAFSGACDAAQVTACDDDGSVGTASHVDFPVTAGTDYLVEAASYARDTGELALTADFVPCGDGVLDAGEECDPAAAANCVGTCGPSCRCLDVPNDECAAAPIATELPISVRVAAYQATSVPGDPVDSCQGSADVHPSTLWYRFRAPLEGTVAIDTTGSAYDTVVTLYSGACDALQEVDCNDDGGPEETSHLEVFVEAGVEYTVGVEPFGARSPGELELSITYILETPQ